MDEGAGRSLYVRQTLYECSTMSSIDILIACQ